MTSIHKLPVVDNCNGCGVCCLHMGYPAFMLPMEKATASQIESEPEFQHHEFRPHVCRELEIGSRLCRQWRTHYRELIQ